VITDDGPVDIDVPRDRERSYEPLIVSKHEPRFTGFDQKIIAMYARGMTVREIQGYLAEMYGSEVSPDFISKVADEGDGGSHRLAEADRSSRCIRSCSSMPTSC
jgi:transposase-like protein